MRSNKENELAKLIEARLQAAKEDGENISEQDVLVEFGITGDDLNHLTAGASIHTDPMCVFLCFYAFGACMCY